MKQEKIILTPQQEDLIKRLKGFSESNLYMANKILSGDFNQFDLNIALYMCHSLRIEEDTTLSDSPLTPSSAEIECEDEESMKNSIYDDINEYCREWHEGFTDDISESGFTTDEMSNVHIISGSFDNYIIKCFYNNKVYNLHFLITQRTGSLPYHVHFRYAE